MKRILDWFVDNPVAANLLMILVAVGGGLTLWTGAVKQELFPDINPPIITVSVLYPGAAPEEVEEAITIKIEEAVHDIEGVDEVTSSSVENVAAVTIKLENDADPQEVLDEVKTRIDAIEDFPPDEAEKPLIRKAEMRPHVVNVAVSSDTDEATLKRIAERIRDDLTALPDVNHVVIANARTYEVSVEVSEESLRRHGLTFDEVAAAVRRSSVDLPGGTLKTGGGEILLRTKGKAESSEEFGRLPLRTLPDGSRLLLRDVARVVDGFEDSDLRTRFNGKPSLIISVFRVGDQGILEVADAVNRYVEEERQRLPDGIELATYWDNSRILKGRMDLLMRNAKWGLGLVLLILLVFFRLRMAFWVGVGMVLAFLGGIWLMPVVDESINLLSLFTFILVLGILVDDAIVVGENIYRHNQMGKPGREASKAGVWEVTMPVVLAVLTTVAAFVPMLTIPGVMGDFTSVIPKIVIVCLIFSLVESLLILPSHLSHLNTRKRSRFPFFRAWAAMQDWFAGRLEAFVQGIYRPVLMWAVRYRYVTLALGVAVLIVTVGLFLGGFAEWIFFPEVEADYVVAFVTMPRGTPAVVTERVMRRLEDAAKKLKKETEGDRPGSVFRHIGVTVGTQPVRIQQNQNVGNLRTTLGGGHLGEAAIELIPAEERDDLNVSAIELARRWRKLAGPIPDAEELSFTSDLMSRGKPITVRLSASDLVSLRKAAKELKDELGRRTGVYDIADSYRLGKKELRFKIKPSAEALGLSEADLARQVRQGYYGEEAQRIQRGREDVKVMVRYPADQRRSLGDVENMRIRLPSGVEVPFSTVAEVTLGRGPSAIERADRQRSITVTADVDTTQGANANDIMTSLEKGFLPDLKRRHPGLIFSLEGQQREQQETLGGIWKGMVIALIVIYAMLAVPLRSYVQPLIIMMAIPFGVAGAIWAHVLLGMEVTMMSLIGVMALTGVVVNDTLIMVDFINRSRREGMNAREAVLRSGPVRFRPIVITSLTTFAGLTPMLLEKSMQAKFLIPMAVALAYGVLFATGVILVLIPATYLIVDDMKRAIGRLFRRWSEPPLPSKEPIPEATDALASR